MEGESSDMSRKLKCRYDQQGQRTVNVRERSPNIFHSCSLGRFQVALKLKRNSMHLSVRLPCLCFRFLERESVSRKAAPVVSAATFVPPTA